jgi:predicted MPP superfamily phosphohydrolase
MIIFFILLIVVYSAVNYYIFRRGWQALDKLRVLRLIYVVVFTFLAYGNIFTRLLDTSLPASVYDVVYSISIYWFAFLMYFILSALFLDIIRLLNSRFHFLPRVIYKDYILTKRITASVVILIVSVIVFLGHLNKNDLTVREINITMPKGNSKLNELNIVMASDLHLSVVEGDKAVSKLTEKINSLNPDIVLFAGDILDDKTEMLTHDGVGESFKKLKPKYGIFAINGNHEYINYSEQSQNFMDRYKIRMLQDEYALIDSSFNVIGREDISLKQFAGIDRKPLEEITKLINKNYPKILLDHSPFNLDQAVNNKIDLQLSGHTHHGQLWPLNFFTKLIYEVSWGYKKKGNTHFYISSGASIWGAPVRTGSKSEVVNIKIKFI